MSLHEAARKGDLDAVRKLVSQGADINGRAANEWTPLHEAVTSGRSDLVTLLVQLGADVNARNGFGQTPLHLAADDGHAEVARCLLSGGADANTPDNDEVRPLHLAALRGDKAIVEALLASGAVVNAVGMMGFTPFQLASEKGHSNVAAILKEAETCRPVARAKSMPATNSPAPPSQAIATVETPRIETTQSLQRTAHSYSRSAVWGIDVGQCAMKALRCMSNGKNIVADAFEYIEYSSCRLKHDADSDRRILEAVKTFQSRHKLRHGDKVALSVPSFTCFTKFIKFPPIELSKLPTFVAYEAAQQIPFPLKQVIWNYQKMPGGLISDGFALDAEIGLFAIKRDRILHVIKPFLDARIKIDLVQNTSLALANFAAFDQMPNLPQPEQFDVDAPPESIVILSMGTETSDLLITNGFRLQHRSIPIGGKHFTNAISTTFNRTFEVSESIKCNPLHLKNSKPVFQAMRPVFNELLNEIERTIAYFKHIDRQMKITRGVGLGNAVTLPGLLTYLSQLLGFSFTTLESYRCLQGAGGIDNPAFIKNRLAFGVCYGLCIQALGLGRLSTNLWPVEERPGLVNKFRAIGNRLQALGTRMLSTKVRRCESTGSKSAPENSPVHQKTASSHAACTKCGRSDVPVTPCMACGQPFCDSHGEHYAGMFACPACLEMSRHSWANRVRR